MEGAELLLFTEHFPNQDGGIAQWAYGIAKNLALDSVTVEVFAPAKCFRRGMSDPSPARLSVMRGRNWHDMRNLHMLYYTTRALLRNGRVPFLCSCWDMATVPVLFSKLLKFPVFIGAHGLEVARTKRGIARHLMRFTFRGCTAVFAVSAFTRSLVEESSPDVSRVLVIPNGVDPKAFRPGPRPSYLVQRYGLAGKKVIMTLSRITERKGHETVLRALPRILALFPETIYLIGGTGGHREYLETVVRRMGLQENVVFCGFVAPDELADHYNLCDLYVMVCNEPADDGDVEGFGITYLEAGACGKPVVAAASGGVADAVAHGVNGLIVPPGDDSALASAIISLLGNSYLARRMGTAGRQRVEETFNWRAIAKRVKRVMEEMCVMRQG